MLREWWTHDHLSALSAILPAGKLYVHAQDHTLNAAAVIAVLEYCLREVPGPLVIIWDGTAPQLHGARLPADAPELNLGEGLWAHLKGVELRNVCGVTRRHVRHELRTAVKRARRTPRIIQGCFRGAKL